MDIGFKKTSVQVIDQLSTKTWHKIGHAGRCWDLDRFCYHSDRIYDRIIKLFDKVNWESYLYEVCEWQAAQRKGSEQCMQLTEGQDCIKWHKSLVLEKLVCGMAGYWPCL